MNLENTITNLKKKKIVFEFPYTKNFDVFKIKNFLDEDTYKFIERNFPILKKEKYKESFLKYYISSDQSEYKDLLNKNENFKKINDFFKNKFFSNFFLKKLFFKIIKARLDDSLHLKRMFKIQNFGNVKKSFFVSNLETKIEYSFLSNNAVINPHTDAIKKMISLMLYFPDENSYLNLDDQKKFGTNFWSSKIKNLQNKHINQEYDIEKFMNNNEIVYKTNFEKYHLYGFVRNSLSWHSVDKIQADSKYLRRSININIFFI